MAASDPQPVFDLIAESATKLCGGEVCTVARFDGEWVHLDAIFGSNSAGIEALRRTFPMQPSDAGGAARAIHQCAVIQIPDVRADPHYRIQDAALVSGFRALLAVPMLREGHAIGAITVGRAEAGLFSDMQVQLLGTFAAQAVIAIENTRLLNELRESLENQTASAGILRAIASPPAKAERALDVIAETTARRFEASNVNIRLLDGNILRYVGSAGPTAEHMQAVFPEGPPDANTTSGKAILERRQIYLRGDDVPVSGRVAGIVSTVATPLIREGQAIGVLMVLRGDP